MINERFVWPVRVYYEDTDAAGIVYHANYLRFMERARTEWLRKLGFEQDLLAESFSVLFVVNRTDVKYVRAARLDDDLEVTTILERLRGASIVFEQFIEDSAANPICSAYVGVACVDPRSLKPRRIPMNMLRVFQGGG
jgi:acyl-CoA thioester hydrolase